MIYTKMSKNAGFSLVEMAVVISILAVMLGGALSVSTRKIETANTKQTNQTLDTLQTALEEYYLRNGFYPCPASATADENTTSFGVASSCGGAVPSGTWEAGSGTDTIRGGVIPTRTLGLSDHMMYDEWGGRIAYVVVKALAVDSDTFSSFTTALTDGVIRVGDRNANIILDPSTDNVVAYVLTSRGKDRAGAFARKITGATPPVICNGSSVDSENCDNSDTTFIDAGIVDTSNITSADHYDDLLRWKVRRFANELVSSTSSAVTTVKTAQLGDTKACAIKTDDTLWCWGANYVGQLGDGTTVDKYIPTEVSGGGLWKSVDARASTHTCGIKMDNTLWCWGQNNAGQLGDGTNNYSNVPVQVSGGGEWKRVAHGEHQTCAMKMDNSLWCWGYYASSSVPVELVAGARWKMFDVQYLSMCGIKMDDTLWCSGDNSYWSTGHGTTDYLYHPLAEVAGGGAWKTTIGELFTRCGIKMDDTLWCWGFNGSGVIGDGTTVDKNTPTLVPVAGSWQAIGQSFGGAICGIQIDSSLWCNWYTHAFIQEADTWLAIDGYSQTFCGIKTDSTLWCAGGNSVGETGDGTGVTTVNFTEVVGGGEWSEITHASRTFCGIKTDKTLWCWGESNYGQIGDGTTVNKLVPTAVAFP